MREREKRERETALPYHTTINHNKLVKLVKTNTKGYGKNFTLASCTIIKINYTNTNSNDLFINELNQYRVCIYSTCNVMYTHVI